MDDEKTAYVQDPRIPCRYGRKCFQKNTTHHNKYKHPPDPKRKKIFSNNESTPKKTKLSGFHSESSNGIMNENQNEVSAVAVSNDVSDSDSEVEEKNYESTCNNGGDHLDKKIVVRPNSSNTSSTCTHTNYANYEFEKKIIKTKFLLEMPDDFYEFFKFCSHLNSKNPCEALLSVGLRLVGPYDVLSGKFHDLDIEDDKFLLHWRYFYDPPQMQTVLKGDDKTGYHIGYFRDSPLENPVFMVENFGLMNGELAEIGENIFAAVSLYLEERKKTANPFNKVHFIKIGNMVKKEAERLGLDLTRRTKNMIKRDNKILTRSFNKVGLVVPYDRKTQLGYRKLAMSDKELQNLLTKIQKAHSEQKQKLLGDLQSELLTWTDIACDECDFGTGIELGWNIICHGVEDLNHTAARFLSSNYRQLKWDAFARIAEVHMAQRKKSCDLSVV